MRRPATLNGFQMCNLPSNRVTARNGAPALAVVFCSRFGFTCWFVVVAARSRIVCVAWRKRRGFFWDLSLATGFLPKKIAYIICRSLLSSLSGQTFARK